jgi:hypothetical protein
MVYGRIISIRNRAKKGKIRAFFAGNLQHPRNKSAIVS